MLRKFFILFFFLSSTYGVSQNLNRYDRFFSVENGLSHSSHGLVKMSFSTSKTFTTNEGLKLNNVWCSIEVKNDEPWLASNSGLAIIRNEKVVIPDFSKQIGYSKIFSLYKDAQQRVCVGSQINYEQVNDVILCGIKFKTLLS